ncbi:MAG: Rieske 2Fe-2S domain-containing protein [Chloroflexi bacterium]|nr:Rieske 2Fe-2S domain-containing protein [Chloroflexota bacterium]
MASVAEGYVVACAVSDLPARGKKTVKINGVSVLVVACESGYYAIENRCPQTGRPIAHGKVLNCKLTSPHTGARYDLTTGKFVGGGQSPLQSHWLTVFPLSVVDDKVYIHLS